MIKPNRFHLSMPLAVFAVAILSGCTAGRFTYPANNSLLIRFPDTPPSKKTIAVFPFEDARGHENQKGTMFLYLIPFSPGGFASYERPDARVPFLTVGGPFEFMPREDLAKAAAYSLQASNLVMNAFFSHGSEKSDPDYILKGTIYSTKYKCDVWTYGLSVFGPLPWLIGAPAGQSHNEIDLELNLIDAKNRQSLWSKRRKVKTSVTQGLYYKVGHDVKGYAQLMQDIMNEIIPDMRNALFAREVNFEKITPVNDAPKKSVETDKDAAVQLKKLKELNDSGLITDVEYEAKRKTILDNL